MLVDKNTYLTSGIYIGMKSCTPYMKQFVYRIREDGLGMFNLKKIDERLKITADFLSSFGKVLIVSKKENSGIPIKALSDSIDARCITGRFPPGLLTNPSFKEFYEPDVVFIADPLIDEQAIKEAKAKRVPIVALCNTFNSVSDIDLVIPSNNNGRKSLALIYWILAKEIMKKKGKIKKDEEFKLTLKDFGDI